MTGKGIQWSGALGIGIGIGLPFVSSSVYFQVNVISVMHGPSLDEVQVDTDRSSIVENLNIDLRAYCLVNHSVDSRAPVM
jgi:hypothetical protein